MKVQEATVISDLFHVGTRFDDGQAILGDVFYVMVEAANGQRWVHNCGFPGARMERDDETGEPFSVHFADEAEAQAQRLCGRVNAALGAGVKLDPACWSETDPAYGSQAYQAKDEVGFFKAREKREDHF